EGRTRGELEAEVAETFGGDAAQLVYRGLAKLLEDRCEFEVISGQPPEKVREVVFGLAAQARSGVRENSVGESGILTNSATIHPAFDRTAVLGQAAKALGMTPDRVEQSLFADLKSEQRLTRFKDTTAERLLHRYNVALAQAV